MSTDVTVILDDRPGELARLGEAAAAVGVNIQGLAAFTGDSKGVVHVLLDDSDVTRFSEELGRRQMGVADEREVLVFDVDSHETLHKLINQWAENVPATFEVTAMIPKEVQERIARAGTNPLSL